MIMVWGDCMCVCVCTQRHTQRHKTSSNLSGLLWKDIKKADGQVKPTNLFWKPHKTWYWFPQLHYFSWFQKGPGLSKFLLHTTVLKPVLNVEAACNVYFFCQCIHFTYVMYHLVPSDLGQSMSTANWWGGINATAFPFQGSSPKFYSKLP